MNTTHIPTDEDTICDTREAVVAIHEFLGYALGLWKEKKYEKKSVFVYKTRTTDHGVAIALQTATMCLLSQVKDRLKIPEAKSLHVCDLALTDYYHLEISPDGNYISRRSLEFDKVFSELSKKKETEDDPK